VIAFGSGQWSVEGEFILWQEKWNLIPVENRPNIAFEAMMACDVKYYPNIHRMLKLCVTLPVSTATAERSFSTLRRMKTYLRNSIGEDRLNGLALLHIHREVVITVDEVLDRFASKKRRLPLTLQ